MTSCTDGGEQEELGSQGRKRCHGRIMTFGRSHVKDGWSSLAGSWMRDTSGANTPQEGGDRVAVAVNEAYRFANLWWRRW